LGKFEGSGKALDWKTFENEFFAEGIVEVKEGKIKDANVLKIVLSHIPMMPNLVDEIIAKLPEKYKRNWRKKIQLSISGLLPPGYIKAIFS